MTHILGFVLLLSAASSEEIRGVWLTTLQGLDWPHSLEPAEQQQEFRGILDHLASLGLNTIFLQVRMRGNAIYPNPYEPFAAEFSGELGKPASYDPLEFALREAHERGFKVHAWFNTFKAWSTRELPPVTDPPHALVAHPEWAAEGSDSAQVAARGLFFSPGNPEYIEHVLRQIDYLVSNYDLDGLHFDYIRYPASSYSVDSVSLDRFAKENPNHLTRREWQREQINMFLAQASRRVREIRPDLMLSAAVIGSYQQGWTRSWNAYYHTCQDVSTWLAEGWLDFIVPMTYWASGPESPIPFDMTIADWVTYYSSNRPVIAGLGIYRFVDDEDEVTRQILVGRLSDTQGHIFFRYAMLKDENMDNQVRTAYRTTPCQISDLKIFEPECYLYSLDGISAEKLSRYVRNR